MKSKKTILLVEDDPIDVMAIKRALKKNFITNKLDVVSNGEEALKYLRCPETELPCVILLDLNMPKMGGIEFLRITKHEDVIKRIPVVILTSSKEKQDKLGSFDLGVAGYMLKPVNFGEIVEVIKTIDVYWTTSELPEEA